jgi:hypothetical protein
MEEKVKNEIAKFQAQRTIQNSNNLWRSSLSMVPKDGNKGRVCIDYSTLKEVTTKRAYPLPLIDGMIDTLATDEIFSGIDAPARYRQIALVEADIEKTAFSWSSKKR